MNSSNEFLQSPLTTSSSPSLASESRRSPWRARGRGWSPSIGGLGKRLGIGMAVIGLGVSGIIATAPGSASAVSAPSVDHFLCYAVIGSGFAMPTNVVLKDALQPNDFLPGINSPSLHCNPVNQSVTNTAHKTTVTKVLNATAHLLCWNLSFPPVTGTVKIVNQFGTSVMTTGTPNGLCLPTWKSLTGPPSNPNVQPSGLDHFACYPLTSISGSYGFKIPPTVKVQNQYPNPYVKVKVGTAKLLCAPATMTHNSVITNPQGSNDLSVTCFVVSKTRLAKRYYDQNQFGSGRARPTATKYFCVPSTIQVEATSS